VNRIRERNDRGSILAPGLFHDDCREEWKRRKASVESGSGTTVVRFSHPNSDARAYRLARWIPRWDDRSTTRATIADAPFAVGMLVMRGFVRFLDSAYPSFRCA
jgi:hypothetical protein